MWLQDSVITAKVDSMPATNPADSTNPFAKLATVQL